MKPNNPENIMEETGEHNKILTSFPGIFLNCESIFIEYIDVIKIPFFLYLDALRKNEYMKSMFSFDEIESLSIEELYVWYNNRKSQNILANIPIYETPFKKFFQEDLGKLDEWIDTFIYKEALETSPDIIRLNTSLNFTNVLHNLAPTNLVRNLHFYTPYYSKYVEEDVKNTFSSYNVTYQYGDLKEVLEKKEIPNNSTFVFSDLQKIYVLKEAKKLVGASVLIADRYGYNYKDDGELNVREDEPLNDYLFRLDFFDNINDPTIYEENPKLQ